MVLPSDLDREVRAKAAEMKMDLTQTIALLVRYRLDVQHEKEAKLQELSGQLREARDPEDRLRLAAELGREVFGG